MSRSCCTARITMPKSNTDQAVQSDKWRPFASTHSMGDSKLLEPFSPKEADHARKQKRAALAAAAAERQLQSQSTVGSQQHDSSYLGAEIALYDFRKRDKSKDLHHEWANPNRLLSEADRIETAERDAKAAFLRNPTFPKE
eukprot:1124641-Pleurochrysis_carterae.AAC.1